MLTFSGLPAMWEVSVSVSLKQGVSGSLSTCGLMIFLPLNGK